MPLVSPGFLLPPDVQSDFGYQSAIAIKNPAAGVAPRRKVPGAFFEIVTQFSITYNTSAAAATRGVHLHVEDGDGNVVADIPALHLIAANTNAFLVWSLALASAYDNGGASQMMPAFPMVMPSGYTLAVQVNNLDAADTFTAIGMVVQQFNTGLEPERFRDIALLDPGSVGTFATGAATALGGPAPAPSSTAPTSTAPPPAPPPPPPPPPPAPASTDMGSGSSAGSGGDVSRL